MAASSTFIRSRLLFFYRNYYALWHQKQEIIIIIFFLHYTSVIIRKSFFFFLYIYDTICIDQVFSGMIFARVITKIGGYLSTDFYRFDITFVSQELSQEMYHFSVILYFLNDYIVDNYLILSINSREIYKFWEFISGHDTFLHLALFFFPQTEIYVDDGRLLPTMILVYISVGGSR